MKLNTLLINSLNLLLLCMASPQLSASKLASDRHGITQERLYDKIKGGWAAKTIGCTYGGPVEFLFNGTMIQDYTPIKWSKYRVKYYFDTFPGLYDDIYVNIVFVNVIERLGLEAPADSFANAFASAGFPLWHANQVAKYNIKEGLKPPMSGHWLNNPHADDIDYQIEADFAGLMSPGMPNSASKISDKVGHIFTYGDGWYGGVYVGALYSMAFISDKVEDVVEKALRTIPKQSNFSSCIRDVIEWHKKYPNDWKRTWFECQKKWSSEVGCPDGVFAPFDIDAKINSAYVTIGLLYGKKDFYKTIDIAARCGQDSDCNAATAAGVLGTMLGFSNIPEIWRESLNDVQDIPFAYTNVSLNQLYDLSFKHALNLIKQNGGEVEREWVYLRMQDPLAVRYEKSFEGHYPIDKLSLSTFLKENAAFTFDGIGFVQKGYVKCADDKYVVKIEVSIDEKPNQVINLSVAKANSIDDRSVDLLHRYQLPKMTHRVSYRWLNPREDAELYLGDVIIYSDISHTSTFN